MLKLFDEMARAVETQLFAAEGDEGETARRPIGRLARPARQLEQERGARSVVVGAVMDLAARRRVARTELTDAKMVVMGADDDEFIL